MKKSLNELKSINPNSTSNDLNKFVIKPSHIYIKFKPKNAEDEAILKNDSTMFLFDYRLDCEYSDEFLKKRKILNDSIPDYYTALTVNKTLPNVPYEILDELYIPEQDEYFNDVIDTEKYLINYQIKNKTDLFNHLIYNSFLNTGNESEILDPSSSSSARWIFGKKWNPSGNIKVIDNIVGRDVPVTGAQILMRQWFTIRQGITNHNGDFSTGSVRGSCRYIIQWERYNYSIRNGSFFQAELRGPVKKDEAWNYIINGRDGDSDDKYHAIIHQAAFDFYYGHRFGLNSPPLNNHFYNFGRQRQIKIAARETNNSDNTGSYSHIRSELTFSLSAQIHVKAFGKADDQVYGTTIHELAHALHSVIDRSSYDNIVRDSFFNTNLNVRNRNKRLLETWPTTVEIMMTLDRYKTKYNNPIYEYRKVGGIINSGNRQYVSISSDNLYTSGGYDMVDNFNQRNVFGTSYPIDRVNGYTLKQLEQALIGATHWNGWKDKIKIRYNNPTEIYLDELFINWQD